MLIPPPIAPSFVPPPAPPVGISLPSIGENIPIVDVGLTPTHNMDVPHNFVQAGWYEYGPVPGQEGSAIIDGHVDNGGYSPTIAGVFKHLSDVKIGDIITVRLADGTTRSFSVISSAAYGYADFPSAAVFGQTGGAYLKIITCYGTWIPSADTYDRRLVVTAKLI